MKQLVIILLIGGFIYYFLLDKTPNVNTVEIAPIVEETHKSNNDLILPGKKEEQTFIEPFKDEIEPIEEFIPQLVTNSTILENIDEYSKYQCNIECSKCDKTFHADIEKLTEECILNVKQIVWGLSGTLVKFTEYSANFNTVEEKENWENQLDDNFRFYKNIINEIYKESVKE